MTGHLGGSQSKTLPILDLWGGKLLTEVHRLGVVGACVMLQQDHGRRYNACKVTCLCLRNSSLCAIYSPGFAFPEVLGFDA